LDTPYPLLAIIHVPPMIGQCTLLAPFAKLQFYPGAHAVAFRALSPALLGQLVLRGESTIGDDSFPQTQVQRLDPAMRIFRAALTSRSCDSPQCAHAHCLTTSCLRPLGPARAPQLEQARVVLRSLTTCRDLHATPDAR